MTLLPKSGRTPAVGLVVLLLISGCAARARVEPEVASPTLANGEPVVEGEVYEDLLDLSEARGFRYGAVTIQFTAGVISNIDPGSGAVVSADDDWFAVLDAEITKVVEADYSVTGHTAKLILADGEVTDNTDRASVEPELDATEPKRFVFRVPPGSSWPGSSFQFGRSSTTVAVVALTGPPEEPAFPRWLEPGSGGAAEDFAVQVNQARVTLDDLSGERAARDTKHLQLTVQLLNSGDEPVAVQAETFRFVIDDELIDPQTAPALSVAPGSSVELPLSFVIPVDATVGELLVSPTTSAAALSLSLDLDDGRGDDQPYPPPPPLEPTTTTPPASTTTAPAEATTTEP